MTYAYPIKGYGFSCGYCRAQLNFDDLPYSRDVGPKMWWGTSCARTGDEAERRAGAAGWGIGHWDGQGEIRCPDCADTVWDFHVFLHEREEVRHQPREVIIDHGEPKLLIGRAHANWPIAFYEFWEAVTDELLADKTLRAAFLGIIE